MYWAYYFSSFEFLFLCSRLHRLQFLEISTIHTLFLTNVVHIKDCQIGVSMHKWLPGEEYHWLPTIQFNDDIVMIAPVYTCSFVSSPQLCCLLNKYHKAWVLSLYQCKLCLNIVVSPTFYEDNLIDYQVILIEVDRRFSAGSMAALSLFNKQAGVMVYQE